MSIPREEGMALFHDAEGLFQAKAYTEALQGYNEYLTAFPQGTFTDTALMRISEIQDYQGHNDLALKTRKRLIRLYPESRHADDAMLDILIFQKKKGRFKQAVLQAADIIEKSELPGSYRPNVCYFRGSLCDCRDSHRCHLFLHPGPSQGPGENAERHYRKAGQRGRCSENRRNICLFLLLRVKDFRCRGAICSITWASKEPKQKKTKKPWMY